MRGCEELLLEEKVDTRRYKGDHEARCSNQHFFLKKSGIFFSTRGLPPFPFQRNGNTKVTSRKTEEREKEIGKRERREKQELRLA